MRPFPFFAAVAMLGCFAMIASPTSAFAHASGMGPHHGPITSAGPYHLELVIKDGEATLYVTDHADKPIDMTGAKAETTVLAGKTAIKLTLAPTGGSADANVLKAKADLPASLDGAQAAATLILPSGATFQARFDLGSHMNGQMTGH